MHACRWCDAHVAHYYRLLLSHTLSSAQIAPEPMSFAHILQSLHSDAAKNRIYDDARGGSPAGAILQKQFESLVSAQVELKENAINAYHSYLRAYAAYPKSLKSIFHPKKLHIGHVARSFGLNDAPTQLARSEIVAKQRTNSAREGEREKEKRELTSGQDETTKANTKAANMSAKKKLVPQLTSAKPSAAKAAQLAAANAAAAPTPHSEGPYVHPSRMAAVAEAEGISSGVRPAYGQRDRARNSTAISNDVTYDLKSKSKRARKELSSIGWKLGTEGNGPVSKLAKTGIDRVRSMKVAQVFKKKKIDLASEFAS
jgi:hypothetical protein